MTRRWSRSSALGLTLAGALAAGIAPAWAAAPHPDVVSEVAANWTPHVAPGGNVGSPKAYDAAQLDDTMYVVGKFNRVENANRTVTYTRTHVVSFDATDGAVNAFAPTVNAEVWAVETTDDAVYLGGRLTRVNGVVRRAVVKLDPVTGAVDTDFRVPFRSGVVFDMKISNGRLIVAGSFPQRLLALDLQTGADTGYIDSSITGNLDLATDPQAVNRIAVTPDGSRLIAVGNFTTVDGANRKRVFMLNLDASGDTLSDWWYTPLDQRCLLWMGDRQDYITDVDFSPDGSYFVLVSTGLAPLDRVNGWGTELCDVAARFETDNLAPTQPTWVNYTGGDTLQSVAITGAAVYVQGHSRWLNNEGFVEAAGPNAVVRWGGGAIDPVTGLANDWDPIMKNTQGGMGFLATDAGLWLLRDGQRFAGAYHRGIVFAPLP